MVNDTKERIPDAAADMIACYEARSGSPKHLPCPWDKVAPDILPAGVAALCRDGLFPWSNFGRQMGGEPPQSRFPWALSGVWYRDSLDWKDYDADTIFRRVTSQVGPGSIVLFHNAALHTPEALPGILEWMIREGYTVVPISELILQGEYTIDHTGRQFPAGE